MPSPSANFIDTITASAADDVYLVLIRLSCPQFPDWDDLTGDDDAPANWPAKTLCFVANDEDIISNNITHLAWGFDFVQPNQDGFVGPARLLMDNVDSRVTEAIKLLPPTAFISVTAEVVLSQNPDLVERDFPDFRLYSVSWGDKSITAQLSVPDDSEEPFCSVTYSPFNAPGIYAAS